MIVRVVRSRASTVATPFSTTAVRGASATGSARPRASYEICRSPTAAIRDLALVGVVGVDLVVDQLADRDLLEGEGDEVVRFVEDERLRGELVLGDAELVLRSRRCT